MRLLLGVLGVLALLATHGHALDCSEFDPAKIKLVTFDVFAALMDIFSSLYRNVPKAAPFLSPGQATTFADAMVAAYGKYNDHVFTREETMGMQPFVFVANQSIAKIAADMKLQQQIPVDGPVFKALMAAWSNLIPWPGTGDVLSLVASKMKIGPLSNGDADTLARATSIFKAQNVTMSYIFSSNFPVGAFKPQPAMYAQLPQISGLQPNEILHVAGAPGDGRGAREYGLFSALLHNPPLPGEQPCFLLKNITLLPAVLFPSESQNNAVLK
eukprot:m.47993 g.47993  ORF g.47993 m.47993 type:complete len:271 (+) comp14915_c1_seq1:52-864(+)